MIDAEGMAGATSKKAYVSCILQRLHLKQELMCFSTFYSNTYMVSFVIFEVARRRGLWPFKICHCCFIMQVPYAYIDFAILYYVHMYILSKVLKYK